MEKSFKNIAVLILIIGFILPYFSFPKKAEAQQYLNPGDFELQVNGQGLTGYVSGLAPAITDLPLCKARIKNSLRNLFSGQEPVVEEGGSDAAGTSTANEAFSAFLADGHNAEDALYLPDEEFEELYGSASSESTDVPTFDKTANKKLDKLDEKTGQIQKDQREQTDNDTCLKSIGRIVIGTLIKKLTQGVVRWIQNGFEGGPAFIVNPGEYFRDLARVEILEFGLEINNPVLYPFGKSFIQRRALAFNRSSRETLRYTLNDVIGKSTPQYTSQSFQSDFKQGGWNAWLGLTQEPANNSLGFQIIAEEELSQRINTTTQQKKDELEQAEGYLGDLRCADPKGITWQQHMAALIEGNEEPIEGDQIGDAYNSIGEYVVGTCRRWEYVTPGQIISESATTAINYPTNALLDADDLNDAVASIIDALLTQFSTQLTNKGFAYLPDQGADGSFLVNNSQYDRNYLPTQTQNDYGSYANSSGYLRKHHDFNIRVDLTQAFIDTQRTYVEKLKDYNDALRILVRNIYQLDFCIPGPNPLWKNQAYDDLNNVARSIPSTAGGQVNIIKGLFTMLKGITVGVSFIVKADFNIGYISEGAISMLGEGLPEEIMTRYFYTTILINHTGLRAAPSPQIGSKGDVVNIMNEIIDGYDQAVKKTFNKNVMPEITGLAHSEYRKVRGYNQLIENNTEEIARVNSTIATLYRLKQDVAETVSGWNAGSPEPGDETLVNPQLAMEYEFNINSDIPNTFARVSTNLVDGDDISGLERLIGRAKDNTQYVYKDLLTGEAGCECHIAEQGGQLEEETDRMPYPKDIFIPFPGKNYASEDFTFTCAASNIDPTECQPPMVLGNNGECVYVAAEACEPAQVQAPGPDQNNVLPPLPAGCQEPNDESNPFDQNEDEIDIECPEGQISITDLNGVAQCVDEGTIEADLNGEIGAIDAAVDAALDSADEADLDKSVRKVIDQFKSKVRCESNFESAIDEEHEVFKTKEEAYKNNNKGFLSRGYYGQVENNNPYGLELRTYPSDAIDSQKVKIPYGVLNQNQQCPILRFGPTVQNGIIRALKSQFKECKKSTDDDSDKEACYKAAWVNAAVAMYRSCEADIDIGVMCKELKAGNLNQGGGGGGAFYDSVRRFEKIMELY